MSVQLFKRSLEAQKAYQRVLARRLLEQNVPPSEREDALQEWAEKLADDMVKEI